MNQFLKITFYISTFILILISLTPGSLIGYLLYGDWGLQPTLIKNPFGSAINHFVYYLYLSLLGFSFYSKNEKFNKIRAIGSIVIFIGIIIITIGIE